MRVSAHVSVSNMSAYVCVHVCVYVHTYVCVVCVSQSGCEGGGCESACQCFKRECMCVHTYVCVLCVSLCKWLCVCVSVHVVVTVVNCPSSTHAMLCDCLLLELTACCTDHAGPTSHGTL